MAAPLVVRIFIAALTLMAGTRLPAASLIQDGFAAALRATPDLTEGEKLFLRCAACHATDGGGSDGGDVPAIAGQYRGVLLRELVDFRHGRRWDVRMERIADTHFLPRSQDLANVAAFASSLQVRKTTDHGDGTMLDHGATLYAGQCASCHGALAAGSDTGRVPRLAAQSYQYLLREMYYTVDNRRPNLAGLHVAVFKRFSRDDFVGIADYLSRLQP
jgi:cytochrome c553